MDAAVSIFTAACLSVFDRPCARYAAELHSTAVRDRVEASIHLALIGAGVALSSAPLPESEDGRGTRSCAPRPMLTKVPSSCSPAPTRFSTVGRPAGKQSCVMEGRRASLHIDVAPDRLLALLHWSDLHHSLMRRRARTPTLNEQDLPRRSAAVQTPDHILPAFISPTPARVGPGGGGGGKGTGKGKGKNEQIEDNKANQSLGSGAPSRKLRVHRRAVVWGFLGFRSR